MQPDERYVLSKPNSLKNIEDTLKTSQSFRELTELRVPVKNWVILKDIFYHFRGSGGEGILLAAFACHKTIRNCSQGRAISLYRRFGSQGIYGVHLRNTNGH